MSTTILVTIAALAVFVVAFVLRGGFRNNDPHNRKAAAEICEYLVDPNAVTSILGIAEILRRNARFRSQSRHIATMVPVLLNRAGMPWNTAKETQAFILAAADMLPE